MATHSSILALKTPWTEETGGLQSMSGHQELDMTDLTHTIEKEGERAQAGTQTSWLSNGLVPSGGVMSPFC